MEEYHQVTLSEYMEMKDEIRRELSNQAESFIRTGYCLRKIEDSETFRQEGYESIYEFAEREFNLSKSTVSRLKSINKEFSEDGYSRIVDARYKGIGKSILAEMLALPDPDRALVTPETAREDVRELRRFNKDADGTDRTPMYAAFAMFLDKTPDAAERVARCIRAGNTDAEHLSEAVAPSGSKMFRAGTKFLAFSRSDIKVKTFGGGQEVIGWDAFAEAAETWLEDKEDENGADGRNKGDIGDHGRISGEDSGSDTEVLGNGGEDRERDQGSAIEDWRGIPGDDGLADRSAKEPDTDPEGREPADDSHNDEDAGSGHDDRKESGDEEAGQLEKDGDEEPYGDAETEPVAEGPEEAATGGMNPPVEEPEPVAPAQQKPKKTVDISKIQPIVDEKGQPAPEEQSLDIRVMRVEASQICRDLSNNIGWRNWKKALECVEMLQPKLRALAFHDK